MREFNFSMRNPCSCSACYFGNRTKQIYRSEFTDADVEIDADPRCTFTPMFNELVAAYGLKVEEVVDDGARTKVYHCFSSVLFVYNLICAAGLVCEEGLVLLQRVSRRSSRQHRTRGCIQLADRRAGTRAFQGFLAQERESRQVCVYVPSFGCSRI